MFVYFLILINNEILFGVASVEIVNMGFSISSHVVEEFQIIFQKNSHN